MIFTVRLTCGFCLRTAILPSLCTSHFLYEVRLQFDDLLSLVCKRHWLKVEDLFEPEKKI